MTITRRDIISTVILGIMCAGLVAVTVVGIITARNTARQTSADFTRYRVACVNSGGEMHGMDCVR